MAETVISGRMAESRAPPGPDGHRISTILSYLRDNEGFVERAASKYGDVVAFENVTGRNYLLCHPDHVERVLVVDDTTFEKKENYTGKPDPVFRKGIVAASGERWQRQRRMAGAGLDKDAVREHVETVAALAHELIEPWTPDEHVRVTDEMSELTYRAIGETLFDADLSADSWNVEDVLLKMEQQMPVWLKIVLFKFPWAPVPGKRRLVENTERLEEVMFELVDRRRSADASGDDVLSILVRAESEGVIDEDEIRDQLVTLLFAGHGNVATVLTYALVRIAHRPEVQRRLHRELADVPEDRPLQPADLSELTYVEQAVEETLRLYPPAPVLRRIATTDVDFEGYTIPAGGEIKLPLWLIHRDERFWDRPEEFCPERWDDAPPRSKTAYFPFGAGLRRCPADVLTRKLGKITLATVFREFELQPEFDDPDLSPRANVPADPPFEMTLRNAPITAES